MLATLFAHSGIGGPEHVHAPQRRAVVVAAARVQVVLGDIAGHGVDARGEGREGHRVLVGVAVVRPEAEDVVLVPGDLRGAPRHSRMLSATR